MAKYIVDSYTPQFEKNFKFPMIQLIPGIIWSIPLHQKLFPDANWWMTFGLCAAFVVLFELCVFINATLPWLEGRLANKPNIRVER